MASASDTLEFRLPDIGEGVAEGEVVAWHVGPGTVLAEDDPMVDVLTDKASVTIESPASGVVSALHANVGEVARVGDVLLTIVLNEGATLPGKWSSPPQPARASSPAATAVGTIEETLPGTSAMRNAAPPVTPNGGHGVSHFQDRPLATPATRKLAKELGVDLRFVAPTGAGGRVTKQDVSDFIGTDAQASPSPARPRSSGHRLPSDARREPFVGMRRKISERMQEATRTAAHFTFVEECDVTRLVALRAQLQPEAERRGLRLNYLPFVILAVVAALREHPVLNSSLDEERNEVVYHDAIHIGIATATEQGLVVPVIRNADEKRLLELAEEITRLSNGARDGTLSAGELRGSTFTVTSLGKQSGLFATPILNMPEVGILGVHRIKEKPIVTDATIAIGSVMLLSLSMDHRVVDGNVGAAFAYAVIERLENPESVFFEYL